MLARDEERFAECAKRADVLPLGSGAIAGSTIALNRDIAREKLGFREISRNSMDAISDRDFVAEFLFAASLTGVHLSRLSEDIILWASAEFNFVEIGDAFTTGSSLMPQKKNPDVSELTRGSSGRLIGNLVALLTILKGLPMTYNRDLQHDKEPLFESARMLLLVLRVNAQMLLNMKPREEHIRAAVADPMLLATDLADYLVRKGLPFRQAHEAVGKLVALSVGSGTPLNELTAEQFAGVHELFGADALDVLKLETSLGARVAVGAPSPIRVAEQLVYWQERLKTS
jgi:argininosuccinate lyase